MQMDTNFDPKEHIEFITNNGKTILSVDYSKCKDKWQMIELLEATVDHYRNSTSKLLTLSDFNNVKGSSEFMDTAKRLNREVLDEKTEKGAVIGVTGLKKVLLQGYNLVATQKLVPFDSKDEAIGYLTQ
jgi:hypothetical protein